MQTSRYSNGHSLIDATFNCIRQVATHVYPQSNTFLGLTGVKKSQMASQSVPPFFGDYSCD